MNTLRRCHDDCLWLELVVFQGCSRSNGKLSTHRHTPPHTTTHRHTPPHPATANDVQTYSPPFKTSAAEALVGGVWRRKIDFLEVSSCESAHEGLMVHMKSCLVFIWKIVFVYLYGFVLTRDAHVANASERLCESL